MLGVFIALLLAGWKFFITHQAPEAIFLSVTNFLFWWFVITSAILAIIYLVLFLLIAAGGTIWGAKEGGILGGILGFFVGNVLNFILLIRFAVARGLLIFGIYLAHHSLTMAEWNVGKLILGIVLFLIGLIVNKSSKSSSSSSSN